MFRHKFIWILAVALSLSLMTAAVSLVLNGTANPLAGWGGTGPFARFFTAVTDQVRDFGDYFRGVDTLKTENEALREQVAALEKSAREGELAAEENTRLRSVLELRAKGQDFTLEPAWVTSLPSGNWEAAVKLDKGSAYGVAAGNCVMDAAGALVGQVEAVGANWCSLRLLTDAATELGGQAAQSGTLGMLGGDLSLMAEGKLKLGYLTQEDLVVTGETVVTFGTQGEVPSGLTVGTVEKLCADPGGMTKYAVLTPAARLDRLGQVFIITGFQEER